jgi:hypothetical protein
MKPVYAITSNTEISYGETFSFLRYKIYILENNSSSKIYHVKKKVFFRSFNTKLCLFHSNMSEKQDSYFFSIKQKRFLYNEWKFEKRKWNLISSYDRGKSPRYSEYNQIEIF